MVANANAKPGREDARALFGAVSGAGIISIFLASVVSRMRAA